MIVCLNILIKYTTFLSSSLYYLQGHQYAHLCKNYWYGYKINLLHSFNFCCL